MVLVRSGNTQMKIPVVLRQRIMRVAVMADASHFHFHFDLTSCGLLVSCLRVGRSTESCWVSD